MIILITNLDIYFIWSLSVAAPDIWFGRGHPIWWPPSTYISSSYHVPFLYHMNLYQNDLKNNGIYEVLKQKF